MVFVDVHKNMLFLLMIFHISEKSVQNQNCDKEWRLVSMSEKGHLNLKLNALSCHKVIPFCLKIFIYTGSCVNKAQTLNSFT